MRYTVVLAAMLFMLLAPGAAHAADAIVLNHTGLRAGPGRDYPLLANLHKGDRIQVLGCVRGWKWCEVTNGFMHGFVVAQRMGTDYYGRNVQIAIWGPKLGIPYVVFVERPYWERYYHDTPFYHERYDVTAHHNLTCYNDGRPGDCGMVVEEHRTTVVEHHYNGDDDGRWHGTPMYDHRSAPTSNNARWTNSDSWRYNN